MEFQAWTSPSSDTDLRVAASLAPPRWAGVTYSWVSLPQSWHLSEPHTDRFFIPVLKTINKKGDDWELIELYFSQKRLNALKLCMCGYKCTHRVTASSVQTYSSRSKVELTSPLHQSAGKVPRLQYLWACKKKLGMPSGQYGFFHSCARHTRDPSPQHADLHPYVLSSELTG